jgi:hypothetical protein
MMFEESSVGLFVGAIARLSIHDRSAPAPLLEALGRHAPAEVRYPITQTDLLATSAARVLHPLVRLPNQPDLIQRFLPAVRTLGPRLACAVILPPDSPQRSVTVHLPDETATTATPETPAQLLEILSPPPRTGP